eukprot:m.980066 g.980066  ORF g.980066 m.980066 type:complete len:202 (-) comp23963_c0_seq10:34-639(-)
MYLSWMHRCGGGFVHECVLTTRRYGGDMFSDIRDRADDVFISLPQLPQGNALGLLPTFHLDPRQPVAPPLANSSVMRMYHSRNNPCFEGSGRVSLAPTPNSNEHPTCRVDALRRGHVLRGGHRVLCVVRTRCRDNTAELCAIYPGSFGTNMPTSIAAQSIREDGDTMPPCGTNMPTVKRSNNKDPLWVTPWYRRIPTPVFL